MDRRTFVGAVTSALFTLPLAIRAQQAERVPRIAWLSISSAALARPQFVALSEGLRERGWIEGKNVGIEARYAEGDLERLPALAAELIGLKVDVIVTTSSATTWAAKAATQSIPIVMAVSADAVGEGLVSSLSRPGGNITGMTFLVGPETASKQLELLREVAPAVSRVAVLANSTNRSHRALTQELKVAALAFGLHLQILDARYPNQLDSAFAAMAKERVTALLVLSDAMFVSQRQRIAELATKSSFPSIYFQREFVDAGGFMSYGANLSETYRHAATHVDKVLRGAKPGDIPIEQPTIFELVINMKAAKALGITVPPSVLLRADVVIQ